MNDPEWFRDKLLIWMKTIIQSFRYPDIPEGTTPGDLHDDPEVLRPYRETLQPTSARFTRPICLSNADHGLPVSE